ncbi:MAG: hypothetical protein ACE5EK_03615, partial [Nitrospinales bacterium]
TAWGGWFWEFTTINPYIPKTDNPSQLRDTDVIPLWCFDPFTGKKGDCDFETIVRPVPLTHLDAGHKDHEAFRESTLGKLREMELPGGSAVHDNDDCDDSDVVNPEKWDQIINTRTGGGRAFLQYLIPEVSGMVEARSEITAEYIMIDGQEVRTNYPPGSSVSSIFYKVDYHSGFKLQWIGGGVIVNRAYLVPLDLVGEHYEVVRGGKDTHPEANFATNRTLNTLREIAKEFHEISGYKLSINDLSLPWGGMFDLNERWCARKKETGKKSIPHWSHRDGMDVDINRKPIGAPAPINCDPDDALHDAVSEVRGGDVFPKVVCEAGKVMKKDVDGNPVLDENGDPVWEPISKYHIDFGY